MDESFATVQNATVQAYAIWQLNETGNTTVTQPDEEIEDEDVPLASAPANPSETPKTGLLRRTSALLHKKAAHRAAFTFSKSHGHG